MTLVTPGFHFALSRLATTNDAASAQDASFLQEVINGLNAQADETRTQLRTLEEKLQDIERDSRFFKSMLSPSRRIPQEIWGAIFSLLVEMEPFCNAIPATLSSVCKPWRRAAFGSRELWARVMLDPSRPGFSSDVIIAWLNRSGSLPRSVRVESKQCSQARCLGTKCAFSKPDIANILALAPLLQHVDIHCPTPRCSQNLFAALKSASVLPQQVPWDDIRSLHIHADWSGGWDVSSIPTFSPLPLSLKTLRLDLTSAGDLADNCMAVRIPPDALKNLTTLHFQCDWSADHVFRVLRHCCRLEHLTLDFGDDIYAPGWDTEPERIITLPRLTSLDLRSVPMDAFGALRSMRMPSILDISIYLGRKDEPWLPGVAFDGAVLDLCDETAFALRHFLRGRDEARPSTVKSLSITNGDFQDYFADIMTGLTSVVSLTLNNVALAGTPFAQLSSTGQLPHLKTLNLLGIHLRLLSELRPFAEKRGAQLTVSQCEDGDCICQEG